MSQNFPVVKNYFIKLFQAIKPSQLRIDSLSPCPIIICVKVKVRRFVVVLVPYTERSYGEPTD